MRLIGILVCFALSSSALSSSAFGQDNLTNIPDTDPDVQLESFRIKEGFEIDLFVSDPMIDPPIQMAWDEAGRMWLVTSTSYPQPLPGQEVNDKVFVLEDVDGDGKADYSTVFAEGLLTPTGVLPGDGGVYVVNSTELLHLRDTDGDGRADESRVVLSGFGADDTHHLLHTLRWGPDGKMYMNQSVYTYSHIETPWGVKRLRGGGIWRFDTETLELEVFSRGLWNPWGYEVTRWGQSFATDGAGFQGIHFMFPDIAYSPAVGVNKVLSGLNMGDPKYSGLAIVSGRHFPEEMQGNLITNDYRANRVKHFIVAEDSSGYSATKLDDLVWSDHYAFRPVDVTVGPDGAIYLVDWYNPIIQHGEVDFRDPRRDHKHGRIWKVTAKGRPLLDPPNLHKATVEELLDALKAPEDWTRTQAKRLLREQGAAIVKPALDNWVQNLPEDATHAKLEALWTYQALRLVEPELLKELLEAKDHRARSAALRVLYYWIEDIGSAEEYLVHAINDEHPQVRREALHALGQAKSPDAVQVALKALGHPMDVYLEYALWNTVRSLSDYWVPEYAKDDSFLGSDPATITYALRVVEETFATEKLTLYYSANRVPEHEVSKVLEVIGNFGSENDLGIIYQMVLAGEQRGSAGAEDHLDILITAARDREVVAAGEIMEIGQFFIDNINPVRSRAIRLAGLWKVESLRKQIELIIEDEREEKEVREAGLDAMVSLGGEESVRFLENIASTNSDGAVRVLAARRLVLMDLKGKAQLALQTLVELDHDIDPWPLLQAFIQQENGRTTLTEALKQVPVPEWVAQVGFDKLTGRGSASQALREMFITLGAKEVVPKMELDPSWYELQRLEHDTRAQGDVARGKEIYNRPSLQCTVCHVINGEGVAVGPDLSSIGVTAPADYLIESLLKPEVALKDGYALVQVEQKNGNLMVGLLAGETTSALLLKDASGFTHSIPLSQIEERAIIPGSLMPAGLMAQLERDEFLDLLAYLSSLGKE